MAKYLVEWSIDIEAETPREAAEQALAIQRRQNSSAVVFNVLNESGETETIDLEE